MVDLQAVLASVGEAAITLVVVVAAVYVTAVADGVLASWVAGRHVAIGRAMTRPVATAAALLLQGRGATERPDAALGVIAPAILGGVAATAVAIVPTNSAGGAAGVDSGIVYFGAAMALVMVAVFLHGWSADSAFPLIGAYRFVAEALSYEMPLALVLIGAALPAQSLAIGAIVQSQAHWWNVVRQPLGLPLYLITGMGLAFWGPLALPDGADIAGGTAAEASGVSLLAWRAARLAVLVAVAAMGAAAFLGGGLGPVLPGAVWVALKTGVLLVVMLWAGHTFARVRTEWFVRTAWTVLIPLALVDVFVSGAIVLWSTKQR